MNKLTGLFPHTLPVGLKEYDKFCKDLFKTYNILDMPSYRNAIASMIMHLPPQKSKKSPAFFAKSVRKAQANQTAFEVIQQIREEEKKQSELHTAEQAKGNSLPDEPLPNKEV